MILENSAAQTQDLVGTTGVPFVKIDLSEACELLGDGEEVDNVIEQIEAAGGISMHILKDDKLLIIDGDGDGFLFKLASTSLKLIQ